MNQGNDDRQKESRIYERNGWPDEGETYWIACSSAGPTADYGITAALPSIESEKQEDRDGDRVYQVV